ncbi:hypothetical protein MJO29_016023 [Puccinia striiformis f. sp. tritici]|nr:hypothetical protein MJO29_016023 [Puccinia striiformis f. sp. tritici]
MPAIPLTTCSSWSSHRFTRALNPPEAIGLKSPNNSEASNFLPERSSERLEDLLFDHIYDVCTTGTIPAIEFIQLDETGGLRVVREVK